MSWSSVTLILPQICIHLSWLLFQDLFCHHTFNCIYEETYSIEITDYGIYINYGDTNAQLCPL